MVGLPELDGLETELMFTLEVEKSTRWEELSSLARLFSERVLFNDKVFFEEPPLAGSKNIRSFLALSQTCGALLAVSLGRSYVVPVATWKKTIVGHGGASKELVSAWVDEHHRDLHRRSGGDQNLLDASCLALYGTHLLTSARLTREDQRWNVPGPQQELDSSASAQ